MLVHTHPTQVATPSSHHTAQVVRPLPLHTLEGSRHGGQHQVGALGQVTLVTVLQEELVPVGDGQTDVQTGRWASWFLQLPSKMQKLSHMTSHVSCDVMLYDVTCHVTHSGDLLALCSSSFTRICTKEATYITTEQTVLPQQYSGTCL